MDAAKTKYLKQNQVKVYNCTFQLQLFQLRIFLRFPCKFFVEWKTNTAHQLTKTQGFVQNSNGIVNFNQKLTLQIQMLYKASLDAWIRKDSTISVYLITKNKPDFNQLVGRINIDLSTVCQSNPYQKALTQSLTYSSTSADLKFSLNMKYSLMSKKTLSQVDLHDFNEKLSLTQQNDSLNKPEFINCIKNMQPLISPIYQVPQSPISIHQKSKEVKRFHFPVSKLENYGHEVHQIVRNDDEKEKKQEGQFELRMTLGKDKNPLTKQDYDQIIEVQMKGMKKSNLMVVPDMKKSRVEEDDFQQNTDPSKKSDGNFPKVDDFVQNSPLKKTGSESQLHKQSKSPQQSDIDIVVDLSEAVQSKDKISSYDNNLKNSINSSKSFSISRFRTQLEGSGGQRLQINKESIDPLASLQIPITLEKNKSSNHTKNEVEKITQKYESSKNRIQQLQNDVSQLVKMLTDTREKAQKLECQKKKTLKLMQDLTFENAQLQKKLDELQQKASYDSRINQINCQKLKLVSSQLTQQKRRTSKIYDNLQDVAYFGLQIKALKENLKKISFEKNSLEEKLFRRDEIQLQNEIRIQELQEELRKYRTQKLNSVPKTTPSALQLESRILKDQNLQANEIKQKEYIGFLQEKIQKIEKQNISIKKICNQAYQSIQIYTQRDQRMKKNVLVAEKQFQTVVKLLIETEKSLKQKIMEISVLKKDSSIPTFALSARPQDKLKALEQELKKKDEMLQFYQSQIHLFEKQLAKTQNQNKELTESQKTNFRQSQKFEGDLRVIKEEESYRQSLASSGEIWRLSFASPKLNLKEQNAAILYKTAVNTYFTKYSIDENFDIEFTVEIQDLRWKVFEQLGRSAKIITDLMQKNQRIKTRLDELQQQEKISAGSSNITPLSGNNFYKPSEEQIVDQYSQATKKRSPLSISNEGKLSREVQKLKSLLYDKNKEMNDLIVSYEKLRLEMETQAMLMKTKKVTIKRASIANGEESDTELVHDLLDLQIRLNKQKEHKSQIMSELSLQKSLNKSQQISQYANCDIAQIYKEIRSIILSRQNFITTQQSLNRLVARINEFEKASKRVEKDSKLMYVVEEKCRSISKEIQVMKSALFKMNFKEIQPYQYKTTFAGILRPCQTALNQLLASVQQMVNVYG